MKALKILTIAFIASLFMWACEDAPEPIRGPIVEVVDESGSDNQDLLY